MDFIAVARSLLEGTANMPQALASAAQPAAPVSTPVGKEANRARALKILSKSLYRELRQNGYEPTQIVALATELISLVTSDIRDDARLD
jgi:hypothetical protein